MKARKPLLGMLVFSYYSVGKSVIRNLLMWLVIGIIAVIISQYLGTIPLLQLFMSVAGAAPLIVLMQSGGTAKWEQYQLAMPIKRKNLATILYLNVFMAMLMTIPVIAVFFGVGFIFSEVTPATITQSLTNASFIYGYVFLLTAIVYPLACTRFGAQNETGLMYTCMVLTGAILIAMTVAVGRMGLTSGTRALLVISIAGVAFVVGLFITKAIYSKIDF